HPRSQRSPGSRDNLRKDHLAYARSVSVLLLKGLTNLFLEPGEQISEVDALLPGLEIKRAGERLSITVHKILITDLLKRRQQTWRCRCCANLRLRSVVLLMTSGDKRVLVRLVRFVLHAGIPQGCLRKAALTSSRNEIGRD